jgi:hypothetical protein
MAPSAGDDSARSSPSPGSGARTLRTPFPPEVPLKPLLLVLSLLLAVALPERGFGQEPEAAVEPRLRVFLLTMDQGDAVWEKFGHNAIVVRNEATGEEIAWNWGLFNFNDRDFLLRFLRGTMRYSMGGFPTDRMLQEYVMSNRTVWAHEVNLTPAEAEELDAFVRWNAREENRHYTYDYFRDNCSTRVRDVLDRVLGGQLAARFQDRATPHSYRWHARKLVQGTLWIDQGLSFLLGSRGDLPRSEWEGMFIPMVLMELLEGVELPALDPETGDPIPGVTRPLLGPRQVVFQATRAPAPSGPPPYSPAWLALGLLAAGSLAGLGRRISDGGAHRAARIALAGGILAWSLPTGILGLLLVSAWFTDHAFIQWNLNFGLFNPLSIPLAGVLVPALLSPRRAAGGVRASWRRWLYSSRWPRGWGWPPRETWRCCLWLSPFNSRWSPSRCASSAP